jgi:hypothetical protein
MLVRGILYPLFFSLLAKLFIVYHGVSPVVSSSGADNTKTTEPSGTLSISIF